MLVAGNGNGWDIILVALGYGFLQSRYFAQIDDQERGREKQEENEKASFMAFTAGNELIFNHQRCSYVKEAPMPGVGCSPVETLVQFIEEKGFSLCS